MPTGCCLLRWAAYDLPFFLHQQRGWWSFPYDSFSLIKV